MQLPQPFLANQVEPSGSDFASLPRAWYPLSVTGERVEASQNNADSGVLKLEFTVQTGHPLAGSVVRSNYNLFNVNPDAVRISRSEFSMLIHALGLENHPINDTRQIFNVPFMGDYGPQENNPKYGKLYRAKRMGDPDAVNAPTPIAQQGPGGQPAIGPFGAPAHATQSELPGLPKGPAAFAATDSVSNAPSANFAPPAASASPSNAPPAAPWKQAATAPVAGVKPPWMK